MHGYEMFEAYTFRRQLVLSGGSPAKKQINSSKRNREEESETTSDVSAIQSPSISSPFCPADIPVKPKFPAAVPVEKSKSESESVSSHSDPKVPTALSPSTPGLSPATVIGRRSSIPCPSPAIVFEGEVIIRRACAGDRKQWQLLVSEACEFSMGRSTVVEDTLKVPLRLVAESTDPQTGHRLLVGLIAASENGWINFLATEKNWQGKGLATYFLAIVMDFFRRLVNVKEISLCPLSSKAFKYWQSRGFLLEGNKKTLPRNAFQDRRIEIQMTRPLEQDKCLLLDASVLHRLHLVDINGKPIPLIRDVHWKR